MTNKILVTGGLGFIGSNLVAELEKRGHEVWVCALVYCETRNYVRCDMSKYRRLGWFFDEHDFDYVYHAAAEYGRWNGEDYYENLWLTNAVGAKNILRMQEEMKFRMIFKRGEVYNLGGDDPYEIRRISDLVLQILEKDDSRVTYKEGEPFTTRTKTPDSTKAKRDLGFNLTVPSEQGIRRTIDWVKEVCGLG